MAHFWQCVPNPPFLSMPRNILPIVFLFFPVVYYFSPSWPNLVDSVIAWGREHPSLWAPLVKRSLAHLEILAEPGEPDVQFKQVQHPHKNLTDKSFTSTLSPLHQDLTTMFVLSVPDLQVTLISNLT